MGLVNARRTQWIARGSKPKASPITTITIPAMIIAAPAGLADENERIGAGVGEALMRGVEEGTASRSPPKGLPIGVRACRSGISSRSA